MGALSRSETLYACASWVHDPLALLRRSQRFSPRRGCGDAGDELMFGTARRHDAALSSEIEASTGGASCSRCPESAPLSSNNTGASQHTRHPGCKGRELGTARARSPALVRLPHLPPGTERSHRPRGRADAGSAAAHPLDGGDRAASDA
jgi:hypothetical protein